MSLSANDAADRVSQMTALTERLTERLTVEAAAFEARRPQDVTSALPETQELANIYRRESARVKADPSLIEAAPAAARAALLRATEAFEAVLTRHFRALEASRTLTEGLVKASAREVVEARAPGTGYGASGRAMGADARAVTLNRQA